MAITYTTDHVAQALARLAEQYKGTELETLISAFAKQAQLAEDGTFPLLTDTTVDVGVGEQLDVLGRVVGEPRKSRDDATYRLWIKARIRAQLSTGTVPDLIQTIAGVIAGTTPRVEPQYPATVCVTAEGAALSAALVPEVVALLKEIKAAGVRMLFAYSTLPPAQTFCFDGGSGAGFGDVSNPATGGGFAGITE
jgi:hypothetical protein